MKKAYLLTLLPLLALTGCTTITVPETPAEREADDDIVIPTTSKQEGGSNDGSDSPDENKEKTVSDLTKDEYKLFPLYYVQKVKSYRSYKTITQGVTKASAFGLHVSDQDIYAVTIKNGDYSYYYNESTGFVNTSHEAYYHDNKAIYKSNNAGNFETKSLDDYLDYFGTYPFGNSIEGYRINDEATKSVTKLQSEENHKFKIVFDKKKATTNVVIQMWRFGGLEKTPEFSNISVTITVKDDFTPVSIELESKYSAKSTITATCEQTYTVTFSNFNEEIEIPGLDAVKSKFTA